MRSFETIRSFTDLVSLVRSQVALAPAAVVLQRVVQGVRERRAGERNVR